MLYRYRGAEDTVAIDTLPILGWDIVTTLEDAHYISEGTESRNVFQLKHQGNHSIVFAAEDEKAAMRWKMALNEANALY